LQFAWRDDEIDFLRSGPAFEAIFKAKAPVSEWPSGPS
jgi:hypothetical protein